ncbi:transcriptional regulator, HxlR family [Paludibacter propionicigenes WB4]|uniref:Transcriptional regulator, HxlR family n=1 Tax=Paludibacter propionicigenes (strain DSM 17365 / JCM 13257 / WB4) TaxID=694427 RepID=E4T0N2_PALPW|nr:helix-turn-helix domain-containing protein [Paludibacter propionicigenes]ADQ81096.1 transcriptional regulator, HxlR family [Paludibacter propionicigenes WB4]
MYDFIHNLTIPTAICTFDGEFIDVNQALLDDSKATSKPHLFNYSSGELLDDSSNHNAIIDHLLSGNKVINQKILIKLVGNNNIVLRSTNVSLLSDGKKLMIIQNHTLDSNYHLPADKIEFILKEQAKISQHLNPYHIEALKQIYDQTLAVLNKEHLQIEAEYPHLNLDPHKFMHSIKSTLEIIQGKWTFSIVLALMKEVTLRFNELIKILEGRISARILSNELKLLENNGLIVRQVFTTVPPTVEYSLTEKGKSLNSVSIVLRDWGLYYGNNK